jgi:hypothetical protein
VQEVAGLPVLQQRCIWGRGGTLDGPFSFADRVSPDDGLFLADTLVFGLSLVPQLANPVVSVAVRVLERRFV